MQLVVLNFYIAAIIAFSFFVLAASYIAYSNFS